MILLSLGLIMSLILIILILKGPSLKNNDKSNDNNKEKFQPKMPEGAYQSASELDQAEMEFVEASKGLIKQKQDDDDIGYWIATGINWKFENQVFIGAQLRYSDAEVTLFDSTINTGGLYSMMTIGYQF